MKHTVKKLLLLTGVLFISVTSALSSEAPNENSIKHQDEEISELSISTKIQVFIRTLQPKMFAIETDVFMMVSDLKQKIQHKQGIDTSTQILIYAGKQLDDQRTLADYGIKNGDTIHMILRSAGIRPSSTNF